MHGSTGVVGITKAFRTFYRNWSMPFHVSEQGVEAIEQHFVAASNDIFEQHIPSENLLKFHGGYLMHIGKKQKALELYQYVTERFPESADAYYQLALAYEKSSNLDKAKKAVATSLQLSDKESEEYKAIQALAQKLK